jgi:hypothetical protein
MHIVDELATYCKVHGVMHVRYRHDGVDGVTSIKLDMHPDAHYNYLRSIAPPEPETEATPIPEKMSDDDDLLGLAYHSSG